MLLTHTIVHVIVSLEQIHKCQAKMSPSGHTVTAAVIPNKSHNALLDDLSMTTTVKMTVARHTECRYIIKKIPQV